MNSMVLMLGGNIGDTREVFDKALQLLDKRLGPLKLSSGIYRTEPWGDVHQNHYLNQALLLETTSDPVETLEIIKNIEHHLGRTKGVLNGPRVIDIDIMFYNNLIVNDLELIIPHPRLHLRKFNLVPLAEIVPEMIHPVIGETIQRLLERCQDHLEVYKVHFSEE